MTLVDLKEVIDDFKKNESDDDIFEHFFDLCMILGFDATTTFNFCSFVWHALSHEYEDIPNEIKNIIDKKTLDLIEEETNKWFIKWGIPQTVRKQIN